MRTSAGVHVSELPRMYRCWWRNEKYVAVDARGHQKPNLQLLPTHPVGSGSGVNTMLPTRSPYTLTAGLIIALKD